MNTALPLNIINYLIINYLHLVAYFLLLLDATIIMLFSSNE